jgi:hypothetical protein
MAPNDWGSGMRLLGAIWLIQVLTGLLLFSAIGQTGVLQITLTVAVALGIGMVAAIWIRSTLSDRLKIDAAVHEERLAKLSLSYRKELSRQKTADADRLAALSSASGNSRAGLLRVGILSGGALGIVSALVIAQFVGLALLLIAFSGGGIAGYALSRKLPKPRREKRDGRSFDQTGHMKIIEHR